MSRKCSTFDYHRNTTIDLLNEYTICESFSCPDSPYMFVLDEVRTYGESVGRLLIEEGLLRKGTFLVESGGGYGSLMAGLLDAYGVLVSRVCMLDLSAYLLGRQRRRLGRSRTQFVQGDVMDLVDALAGPDVLVANEVIGDLDTIAGVDSERMPEEVATLVGRYGLEVPDGEFNFNIGAIRLVEKLCRRGLPAFISEHSSDPLVPADMPYLGRGLREGFPREIKLNCHSEYTIRFSHLEKVARHFGRRVRMGPLSELVGISHSVEKRFVFNSRACSTPRRELIWEILDNIREYRYMVVS